MKKSIIYFSSVVVMVSALLAACKKAEKQENLLLGAWDLIMWQNMQEEGAKMVFLPDSTVYFYLNYTTEIGKYSVNKDTLRVRRIGGSRNYLSTCEYWRINKLDTVFVNIIGSDGNYVTAFKKEKFYGKQKQDTTFIDL